MPEYNEIIPGLILGSLDGLYSNSPNLNITTIISVAPIEETPLPGKYINNIIPPNIPLNIQFNPEIQIDCYRFPVSGKLSVNEIGNMIITIADLIHSKLEKKKSGNGNIYIHCDEGVSRSAAAVIYYLVKYHSMDYKSAVEFAKSKRPIINFNEMMCHVLDYLLE